MVCFARCGSERVAKCLEIPSRTPVFDRADRHSAELSLDQREVRIVGALALVTKARVLALILEVVDERVKRLRALLLRRGRLTKVLRRCVDRLSERTSTS